MKVNLKLYHDDDGCENVSFHFLPYTELEEGDTDDVDDCDDEGDDAGDGEELSSHYEFADFVKEWMRHPEYEVIYTIDIYNGGSYYRRVITRVNKPTK